MTFGDLGDVMMNNSRGGRGAAELDKSFESAMGGKGGGVTGGLGSSGRRSTLSVATGRNPYMEKTSVTAFT